MNRLTRRRQVPIVSMPHLASTKNHSTGRTSSTITKHTLTHAHIHRETKERRQRQRRGGRETKEWRQRKRE